MSLPIIIHTVWIQYVDVKPIADEEKSKSRRYRQSNNKPDSKWSMPEDSKNTFIVRHTPFAQLNDGKNYDAWLSSEQSFREALSFNAHSKRVMLSQQAWAAMHAHCTGNLETGKLLLPCLTNRTFEHSEAQIGFLASQNMGRCIHLPIHSLLQCCCKGDRTTYSQLNSLFIQINSFSRHKTAVHIRTA